VPRFSLFPGLGPGPRDHRAPRLASLGPRLRGERDEESLPSVLGRDPGTHNQPSRRMGLRIKSEGREAGCTLSNVQPVIPAMVFLPPTDPTCRAR
jgi:hypothetical protein